MHPTLLLLTVIFCAASARAQTDANEIVATSPQFVASGGLTSGIGVPPGQVTPAERNIDGTPPVNSPPATNPPQAIPGSPPVFGGKEIPIGRPGPGEVTPMAQGARSAQ